MEMPTVRRAIKKMELRIRKNDTRFNFRQFLMAGTKDDGTKQTYPILNLIPLLLL